MNLPENQKILTVADLNGYVKGLLEADPRLQGVYVKGEISNFKNHTSGHFYFTLKDAGGAVSAVMFRSAAAKLRFLPENGMRVIVRGRVSLFPQAGSYQLYADGMEPDGVGALYIAYEQLRRRLEAEGLFRQDRKRPLPKIPSCVGVITSPTGAAVQDILNILGRRFPFAKVVLYPAQVQGEGAAASLLAGIRYFSETGNADVVIIGRGGGSIEDLWAFNDEALARAVRGCSVPVISAVGHETDFTICDFASDLRAPTPSAAAECAVPTVEELKTKFGNVIERMKLLLQRQLRESRQKLERFATAKALTTPTAYIEEKRMLLDMQSERLYTAAERLLNGKKSSFAALTGRLEALNPMAVIARGYSAVYTGEQTLVTSVRQVKPGDRISLRLKDGILRGEIRETELLPEESGEGV